ncbi:alpha/beta-hydrolase [Mollisia scopiformis]|uniref:Alpha/beta-hydrolase n=1 Tax=Mollisia scopiformis TaxID=149040 RepID=A0A132BAL2_MOLSC|nr:alpha/beta-hydrolase [Mollisia scopiformis]KUJ09450.1 alpha/beta-hydrolase [Mollisia scopiformis]
MSLDHEILGRLRGSESKDGKTIQYRGIKYADIPGRWKEPVMLSQRLNPQGSEYDATKYGPSCPQHPGGFAFDLSLVGNVTLALESNEQSEFECLNLVVTVPAGTKKGDKLPVFVWVHGGGLFYGANSWPQYDTAPFVRTSVNAGKPVISVSINYRFGIFGFLASDELKIPGNIGLRDIACAFKWIKNHIAGFGGDPNRLTAAGESAGAILISYLLVADEKDLFQQAILMSGDSSLRRPRDMRWQNSQYEHNVHFLGLGRASLDNRKKVFFGMSAEELIKNLPMAQHWIATVDGNYIKEDITLGALADPSNAMGKPGWCKQIVVGDTADDGTILKGRIMDNPQIMARLKNALAEIFTPAESKRLLEAYSLTGILNPDQQFKGLLNLGSDLRFYFPTLQEEKGWREKPRGKLYRFHFHQKNPLEGTFKGLASHELDVTYLLQNLPHEFFGEDQRLGREMAEAWIKFTYSDGWGNEVMVIGPNEKISFESPEAYDEKYRKGRGKLLREIGGNCGEKVLKLGEMLQGVFGERMQEVFGQRKL